MDPRPKTVDTQIRRWRVAWVGLAIALALHVTDEALTGFLPVYNAIVRDVRANYPFVPLPTFTFQVWLTGLVAAVTAMLAVTPFLDSDSRRMRVVSMLLAFVMVGNALGHLGASIYWRRPAPGVYSSPVLLIAAVSLFVVANRTSLRSSPSDT
ncbi:MAG: HXXEE domain-containing protein [Acidobacteria bacterium]|nr:HXXEE domain-containing protein [Acidobacteriota bacterium]